MLVLHPACYQFSPFLIDSRSFFDPPVFRYLDVPITLRVITRALTRAFHYGGNV